MTRPIAPEAYALRLGKEDVVLLAQASGGGAYADVVAQQALSGTFPKKRLGPVAYQPLVLKVGPSTSAALLSWIRDSWQPIARPRDGALLVLDRSMREIAAHEFTDALITATAFPALDATARDVGPLTLRIDIGSMRERPGSNAPLASMGWKPRLWQASAFRLEIGGIDCTMVTHVDAFHVRRAAESADGSTRPRDGGPQGQDPLHFPNLHVTVAESGAASWVAWHREFVIEGRNSDRHEREGAIVLLAPDRTSELARIALRHVGIARLTRHPAGDDGHDVAGRRALLYCESMEFISGGKA